jgi:hypothetical protein
MGCGGSLKVDGEAIGRGADEGIYGVTREEPCAGFPDRLSWLRRPRRSEGPGDIASHWIDRKRGRRAGRTANRRRPERPAGADQGHAKSSESSAERGPDRRLPKSSVALRISQSIFDSGTTDSMMIGHPDGTNGATSWNA